jgi:hypothetical protein
MFRLLTNSGAVFQLDALYIPSIAPNAADAKLNLIQNAYNLTDSSSPATWTSGQGYSGWLNTLANGGPSGERSTSTYMNTNYILNSAPPGKANVATLNLGVWSLTGGNDVNGGCEIGSQIFTDAGYSNIINVRSISSQTRFLLGNGNYSLFASDSSGIGYYCCRRNSFNQSGFINGVEVVSLIGNIPNDYNVVPITIGGANYYYAGGSPTSAVCYPSTRTIALAHFGGDLVSAQPAACYQAFYDCLHGFGVV